MTTADIKNGLIGILFGKTSYSSPSIWYFGISTSPLSSDGSGFTEPPSNTGYARVAVPNDAANWNTPSNGVTSNKKDIKMNEITIDSGTATHYFLSDSPSGNAKIWDTMTESRPLLSHSSLTFLSGQAKFSIIDA